MEGAVDRYCKLRFKESLSRSCNYSSACKELALILKLSYSKYPKHLQEIVFEDVLTAFRLLPRMQIPSAVSAAKTLLHEVKFELPQERKAFAKVLAKALAIIESNHAINAHKRISKLQKSDEDIVEHPQDIDLVELPQDVLVQIFSFLDLHSLVSASLVCRSWNVASSDNHLWKLMHTMFFNTIRINKLQFGSTRRKKPDRSQENIACKWRTDIKKAYSSRGSCTHCYNIVWVKDMYNEVTSGSMKCKYDHIKPLSTWQVVKYIDGDYALPYYDIVSCKHPRPCGLDSDSDSDSDSVSVSDSYDVFGGFCSGLDSDSDTYDSDSDSYDSDSDAVIHYA